MATGVRKNLRYAAYIAASCLYGVVCCLEGLFKFGKVLIVALMVVGAIWAAFAIVTNVVPNAITSATDAYKTHEATIKQAEAQVKTDAARRHCQVVHAINPAAPCD